MWQQWWVSMSTWLYFWFQSVITQLDYLSMKETTFINRFEMPQRRTFRLFLCVCICYVNDSLNFQSVDSIGPSSTFTERQLGKKNKKKQIFLSAFQPQLMGVFLSQIKVLWLLYMNELCLNYRPPPLPIICYQGSHTSLAVSFCCASCTPETLLRRKAFCGLMMELFKVA